MPQMHLRQPQFLYSACGTFTKHKQRIQKFNETGDKKYIYKNELDKACFACDAVEGSGLSHNIKYTPQNKQLAEELHKPIIREFKQKKCMQYLKIIFEVLIYQIYN